MDDSQGCIYTRTALCADIEDMDMARDLTARGDRSAARFG